MWVTLQNIKITHILKKCSKKVSFIIWVDLTNGKMTHILKWKEAEYVKAARIIFTSITRTTGEDI